MHSIPQTVLTDKYAFHPTGSTTARFSHSYSTTQLNCCQLLTTYDVFWLISPKPSTPFNTPFSYKNSGHIAIINMQSVGSCFLLNQPNTVCCHSVRSITSTRHNPQYNPGFRHRAHIIYCSDCRPHVYHWVLKTFTANMLMTSQYSVWWTVPYHFCWNLNMLKAGQTQINYKHQPL